MPLPIEGEHNRDFFATRFISESTANGPVDYLCGPRTYAGHTGVDFTIRSFAAMDSGVTVRSVTDGTVIELVDGLFDRNVLGNPADGLGNLVTIRYRADTTITYGHLANSSIAVSEGDRVSRGQQIARVGSSGNSYGPHLHFEIRSGTEVLNPMVGKCSGSSAIATGWDRQLEYQRSILLDAGVTNEYFSINIAWKPADPYNPTSTGTVTVWARVVYATPGDTLRLALVNPQGQVDTTRAVAIEAYAGMMWRSIALSATEMASGRWTFRAALNRELIEETFEIP